ncbi:MAG: hypothetical protein FJ090_21205 [Deltaproteobacteria bacterium]|nr:hypothetical protein [Deltaproteobacteria bacterium]
MRLRIGDREVEADTRVEADAVVVIVEGKTHRVPFRRAASGRVELLVDGRALGAWSDGRYAWVDGHSVGIERVASRAAATAGGSLASPMPATVVAVKVHPGDRVAAGQACVVVSAMKTEIVLKSPRDGVVRAVHVQPGQAVRAGEATCELENADAH